MGQPTAVVRRRTMLLAVGLASAGSSLPTALAAQESDEDRSWVLVQDGDCVPIVPLSGDEPVEALYDFTYPMERFEGPPGSEGATFSSHGTTDLQRDDTSILFLYDGPAGLSLVVVHGRLDGAGAGGTVSFTVEGLPSEGEWIVRDDAYRVDGEQAPSNFDRWDREGERHTIDWAYGSGRTDGGAFRGLDPGAELRIEPAFNEAAALSEDHDFGPIEAWEALSGDRDDPERHALRLDRPVTIRPGECPADAGADAGTDVDARIVDVSVASGTYVAGDAVRARVTVENTGGREHTFFVGYSAIDPGGTSHSNDGTTGTAVALGPGESTTVTVSWTVERDHPSGVYGAKVIVWQESSRGNLRTQLDDALVEAAFEVA